MSGLGEEHHPDYDRVQAALQSFAGDRFLWWSFYAEVTELLRVTIRRYATSKVLRTDAGQDRCLEYLTEAKILLGMLRGYEGRSSLSWYLVPCVIRRLPEVYHPMVEELRRPHRPSRREQEADARSRRKAEECRALYRRYESFLERLSEDRRIVFVMYYRDLCSHEEIAEALKRSEDAVRQLKHRALVQLAAALGGASGSAGED